MSCDYQKTVYRPSRPRTANNRTTYGLMNYWLQYTPIIADNPFTRAEEGNFRSMTPVIESKSQGSPKTRSRTSSSRPHAPVPPITSPRTKSRDVINHPHRNQNGSTTDRRDVLSPRSKSSGNICYHVKASNSEANRRPIYKVNTNLPVHLQYGKTSGYDDFHKAFKKMGQIGISPTYPVFGPPRLRAGRVGGSWRHVKEVMQAGGRRIVFVDGIVRIDDHGRADEVPAAGVLQSGGNDLPARTSRTPPQKMTAHEMLGLKAAECGHWNIVR